MSLRLFHAAVCGLLLNLWCTHAAAAGPRLVVIDQDASGPGGSNQWSMLALLQSPDVTVLGIGTVTGNAWMPEETAHTLRLLELIGRRDVPVYRGAVFPLVRDREETLAMLRFHGQVAWLGAWGGRVLDEPTPVGDPMAIPELPEGAPRLQATAGSAAEFLVRSVREHPHQVTVFAAGPLTNLALAQRLDPEFARLAKELVFMGASLNPVTDDDEFTTSPLHEFNLWLDPEAAHIVLTAPWKRITATPVDVSIKTFFTQAMVDALAKSDSPAARYIVRYDDERFYMWDELAALAWLQPGIITRTRTLYLDADLSRGPNYGNTLAWTERLKPERPMTPVEVQLDLDLDRFNKTFIELMSAPTPHSKDPDIAK